MKKAFTLIEMIVVVGIIAVLMSIVLVNVRGATDAANVTKCMSNLRSLFSAANAAAMAGENESYPLAGACGRRAPVKGKVVRNYQQGWISRIHIPDGGAGPGDVVPCYGSGSADEDRRALTAGTLWNFTPRNASIYSCPTFTQDLLRKRKCKPVFSYVMNAGQYGYYKSNPKPKPCGFASDTEIDYQQYVGACMGVVKFGKYDRADRMVMFAELPISQSCSYDPLAKPDTCDATLQFNLKIGGTQYGNPNWKGRSESIGFVHRDKRKRYFGNVIFIDGHVEKFMQPPESSSLKEDALTAHICSGDDVAYDEKGYRFVAEAEDEED